MIVTLRRARRWSVVHPFCGPACGLDNLMLDVLLDPFLLGKRLVRDGVISIQVFTAIHPQSKEDWPTKDGASAGVATSREGHRSPRSGPAVPHPRLGRGRS
jgi:hypothetical protein